ncbi:hypothetical protein scyTo_0023351, partial [Scyliorhinus torazame]|nr:hypothetical protein [Scyliorhinus torazame]
MCEKRFTTKIGLGQHERHEHPALRNEKRLESSRVMSKPGRRDQKWSTEEVAFWRQLMCEDQERLKDIDNWRPITIDPLLLRLFTKIMAKGLSETVWINPRQKGFLAATPGCNENIAILENIIKGAKKNRKDLALVFVDLAKAFDSVGHKLLVKALQRMRLPPDFTTMVTYLYTGNTTMVE